MYDDLNIEGLCVSSKLQLAELRGMGRCWSALALREFGGAAFDSGSRSNIQHNLRKRSHELAQTGFPPGTSIRNITRTTSSQTTLRTQKTTMASEYIRFYMFHHKSQPPNHRHRNTYNFVKCKPTLVRMKKRSPNLYVKVSAFGTLRPRQHGYVRQGRQKTKT